MYIGYKKSALQRILSDSKETEDKSIKRGILRSMLPQKQNDV